MNEKKNLEVLLLKYDILKNVLHYYSNTSVFYTIVKIILKLPCVRIVPLLYMAY